MASTEPRWVDLPDGSGRRVRNVPHAKLTYAGDEPAPSGAYADMSKDDLSAELEKRGLAKTGNKDELIARLEESDAA